MLFRYLHKGETSLEDVLRRVGVKNKDFFPSSPILMFRNTGLRKVTYASCFAFNVKDSLDEIFETVKKVALVTKYGGGVGLYFGNIRHYGSPISEGGIASGVVSWLRVFNEVGEAVRQGGRRRAAMLALLPLSHGDAESFITCKRIGGGITNFNLSVAVTEKDFANPLFKKACELAATGEPGFVFWDNLQKPCKTPEDPFLVNPCGEANIRDHEACVLGSVKLSNMVKGNDVDWDRLGEAVRYGVSYLNDIVDEGVFPFPEHRFMEEINRKVRKYRRIGLGVMGYADLLLRLKIPYSQSASFAEELFKFIRYVAESAKKDNEALLAIAPTGSISMLARCSSGIEPYFSVKTRKNTSIGELTWEIDTLNEILSKEKDVPSYLETAHQIHPIDHIRVLASIQKYVDQSISKTVNLKNWAVTVDLVIEAHKMGLKGITFYKDGARGTCVVCG